MHELTVPATIDRLDEVIDFIDGQLEASNCPSKTKMGLLLAAEEVFVNISQYAYAPKGGAEGYVTVRFEVGRELTAMFATITFLDNGSPFNPLAASDPDITLDADERSVGGLGIFLTKKMVDDASYSFEGGNNILTLKKVV